MSALHDPSEWLNGHDQLYMYALTLGVPLEGNLSITTIHCGPWWENA
jgi:hypothetical protein